MKLWRVPSLLLLRTLLRELTAIRETMTRQTELLAQIADRFAPRDPQTDPEVVRAETGVDYIDPEDQALIQTFVARTVAATGHTPTDEEVLTYLADEKTRDLHQRLIDRAAEMDRLTRGR